MKSARNSYVEELVFSSFIFSKRSMMVSYSSDAFATFLFELCIMQCSKFSVWHFEAFFLGSSLLSKLHERKNVESNSISCPFR